MEREQCPMCDGSFDWALTWVAAIAVVVGAISMAAERFIHRGLGEPTAFVLLIAVLVGAPFVFRYMEGRKEAMRTE